jgi:PLP dependent protein
MSTRVVEGLAAVRARIAAACARAGRSASDVRLIAVTKRHGPEAIRAAYAQGQREFGENYVQELAEKARALGDLPDLQLHLIGHLQRNKLKDLLRLGEGLRSIDTVDSARLAEALAERAAVSGRTLEVLIQVNPAGETQKSGVAEADLGALVVAVRALPALKLTGLMSIPPNVEPEQRRAHFRRVRELARSFELSELSMGMTDDLEQAIEEGATQVRVGTAIFGERIG